jgi:hypothetical protein
MKSKLYILALTLSLFVISSCKKWLPENRMVGTWRLVEVEKKRLFSNDNIATGYESGLFVFNDNGTATYTDAAGGMTGTWSMRRLSDGFYDADNNWHSEGKTILILHLFNFTSNRVIDWYFDRIDFRWSGSKLFAFVDGSSYTYRYDFRKQ